MYNGFDNKCISMGNQNVQNVNNKKALSVEVQNVNNIIALSVEVQNATNKIALSVDRVCVLIRILGDHWGFYVEDAFTVSRKIWLPNYPRKKSENKNE